MNYRLQTTNKGLTLIELMMTIVMFVILMFVAIYILRAVLISWGSSEERTGIDISLNRGIEKMTRDLREAKQIQSAEDYDEIRFTTDYSNYYIYYFYNSGDSYVPPPAFTQTTYELRKATLTGGEGISGNFTYGAGQLCMTDVLPPAVSDLSISGNIVTIDLSITRDDETIRSRTLVRPRNL